MPVEADTRAYLDATAARLPLRSRDPSDMAMQDVYLESLLHPKNWTEAVLDK